MLRDHLDMLYEVGTDALDSLERSNKISDVHLTSGRYQYAVVFNTRHGVASVAKGPPGAEPRHRSRPPSSATR